MHKPINHPSVSVSASYSAAVEVTAPTRWLLISGQVGRDADRNIPDGIEAQAEIAWRNLVTILAEAGYDPRRHRRDDALSREARG